MKLTAWLVLFFSPQFLFAQVLRGTLSTSLGGTGVAGLSAAEGALLNPALVTIYPGSGADGVFRDGARTDGQHQHGWSVGAVDNSKESLFSGAFHYARTHDLGRVQGSAGGELYHGAFGYRFTNYVALGASAYRLSYKLAEREPRNSTQWNWDLGALVMLTPSLGFGYTLRNLAHASGRVPSALRETLNQTVGFYAGVGEIARIRVDLGRRETQNDDHRLIYMAGLETRMRDLFVLRFGYRHDEAGEGRIASAGLGLDGPKLKIDYGVEKATEGSSGALHSVDMRIPF